MNIIKVLILSIVLITNPAFAKIKVLTKQQLIDIYNQESYDDIDFLFVRYELIATDEKGKQLLGVKNNDK